MTGDKKTEACGRCSMSTVVDAAVDETDGERDPFAGDRIEVDESEFARVSPEVWFSKVSARLNEIVQSFTYGR